MVDHDHLGLRQPGARLVVAAAVVARAVARGAGVALGGHGAPETAFGRLVEPVAVAVPAAAVQCVGPGGVLHAAFLPAGRGGGRCHGARGHTRGAGVGGGVVALEQVGAGRVAAAELVELEAAHVAPAPLGQRKAERLRQRGGQGRQVFRDQLLLQRHGGGGDDHALLLRQRQRDHGGRVRRRLAHAGAGLHHRDAARGQGRVAGHRVVARRHARERVRRCARPSRAGPAGRGSRWRAPPRGRTPPGPVPRAPAGRWAAGALRRRWVRGWWWTCSAGGPESKARLSQTPAEQHREHGAMHQIDAPDNP